MRSLIVLTTLAALALTACNGPKPTCQGSLESWFALAKSNSYDDMYAMLIPDHQKKLKMGRFLAHMSETYGSDDGKVKTYDWGLKYGQAVETGDNCIANGEYKFMYKVRGSDAEEKQEYFSYVLHRIDGKWYLEMPGMEKVSGF